MEICSLKPVFRLSVDSDRTQLCHRQVKLQPTSIQPNILLTFKSSTVHCDKHDIPEFQCIIIISITTRKFEATFLQQYAQYTSNPATSPHHTEPSEKHAVLFIDRCALIPAASTPVLVQQKQKHAPMPARYVLISYSHVQPVIEGFSDNVSGHEFSATKPTESTSPKYELTRKGARFVAGT